MIARFTFGDETVVDCDIVKSTYKLTEVYHNELTPADNTCVFSIPFNTTVADYLKSTINEHVPVEVIDSGVNLFTGYVRQKVGFTKQVRNKSIQIECVNPSFLLNKKAKQAFMMQNSSVSTILDALLDILDIDLIDEDIPTISSTVKLFVINEGENYKECITELLFEYGYTFDFDHAGYFSIYPLFNEPPSSGIPELTDGDTGNLFSSVVIQANERRYDGISCEWKNVIQGTRVVFSDTTVHSKALDDPIFDGEWIANYSSDAEILWIDSITLTKNTMFTTVTCTNHGMSASVTCKPSSLTPAFATVSKIQIDGTGFFSTQTNITKVTDGDNLRNHKIKYCANSSRISNLCSDVRAYYKYSGLAVQFSTSEDLAPGSFVKVTAEGQGTVTARVIRKVTTLTGFFHYEAESITEYEASESETETHNSTYTSGVSDVIVRQANELIHGVRTLGSLEEEGAYEDETANYHGSLYTWKDNSWHLINRERYIGPCDTLPDYEEGSYFLASENFTDPVGTTLLVDTSENLVVDDDDLIVAASFNKGSIYVGENGSWN